MTHNSLVSVVRKRLDERKLTPYEFHRQLQKKVSKQTIYNFLEHGKTLRSDTLLILLNALDLRVVHERKSSR